MQCEIHVQLIDIQVEFCGIFKQIKQWLMGIRIFSCIVENSCTKEISDILVNVDQLTAFKKQLVLLLDLCYVLLK